MLNRFVAHAINSFKINLRLVLFVAAASVVMTIFEDSEDMASLLLMTVSLLVYVVLIFMLAIQSHYTTLKSERHDIVAQEQVDIDRARFIKVAILVNLVAYIPMVSAGLVITFAIDTYNGDFLAAGQIPFGLCVLAAVLVVLTVVAYIALSPFIPRSLSNLYLPFKTQIAVNFANWKRAAYYLLVYAFLPNLILLVVGNSSLIYFVMNFDSSGSIIGSVGLSIISFIIGVFDAIGVILFATAFSMHFLDSVANETVIQDDVSA